MYIPVCGGNVNPAPVFALPCMTATRFAEANGQLARGDGAACKVVDCWCICASRAGCHALRTVREREAGRRPRSARQLARTGWSHLAAPCRSYTFVKCIGLSDEGHCGTRSQCDRATVRRVLRHHANDDLICASHMLPNTASRPRCPWEICAGRQPSCSLSKGGFRESTLKLSLW